MKTGICLAVSALTALTAMTAGAQERFSDLVGQVPVEDVKNTSPLMLPYITWGGDMATFYANGGLETTPDTIFHKQEPDAAKESTASGRLWALVRTPRSSILSLLYSRSFDAWLYIGRMSTGTSSRRSIAATKAGLATP